MYTNIYIYNNVVILYDIVYYVLYFTVFNKVFVKTM